jgi:DNA invertase Pin-like site-specific DNA recombinase
MKRTSRPGKDQTQIISYLRVSTADQDTDKNKNDVLAFANTRGFLGQVQFIEEKVSGAKSWKHRKLAQIVEDMKPGNILIVPELSRLGRNLGEVLEVLDRLTKNDVKVYAVKENFQLNGDDMQSKVMRTMFGLFAEIERDLIRQRTREGLAAAKAKGRILGRPKGPGKSKLDGKEPEIEALLKNGSTQKFIANRYGVAEATLSNWLKKTGLDKCKPKL